MESGMVEHSAIHFQYNEYCSEWKWISADFITSPGCNLGILFRNNTRVNQQTALRGSICII